KNMKGNRPMKTTINVVYPAFALASFPTSSRARAVAPPSKSTIFLNPRGLIGFVVCATGLFFSVAPMNGVAAEDNIAADLSAIWVPTGNLVTARTRHTATLLPNGKVLVAGGNNGPALNSAELYDPATGTWTATSSMATARERPTVTLLPNGKVLVA